MSEMLKVECESCKAPYQVDERRVPPTGLKMRCPKCGHTFLVTDPSKGGPATDDALPKPPPPKKATMVGLAPKPVAGLPGKPAAPPPAAPPPAALPDFDLDVALPAVKPAPAGPQRTASFAMKPTAPAVPAVTPPAASAPPAFPGLDDLDLPALAGDVGLPAPVNRPPARKAPAAPAAAPAPPAASPFTFDVDLPAVPAPSGGAGFGAIDLPAPKRGPSSDLPSVKGAGSGPAPAAGFGDLPVAKPGSAGFGDLPIAKPGTADLPVARGKGGGFGDLPAVPQKGGGKPPPPPPVNMGFGEIDLPSVQNDLPQHAGAGLPSPMGTNAHLPSPMGANAHLPSPMGANAHLPSPMGANAHLPTAVGAGAHLPSPMGANAHLPTAAGAGAHLPTAMGAGAHLPTAMGAGAHLPTAMGAGAHLPSPSGAGGHLPAPMGANAHMPVPVSDDRLLPDRSNVGGLGFGELDLPLVGGGEPPPQPSAFGEVDLPSDGGLPPTPSVQPSAGGMAFGEVDLGGSGDSSAPIGPPPAATSAGAFAFQEASLDGGAPPTSTPPAAVPGRLKTRPSAPTSSSRLPKFLGIGLVILVVGGAALQLTPVGAFGHLWISDKLHAGENATDARNKGDAARKKLALDTFGSAQAAADELVEARKRAPRSRPLGAYAAFVEYANQVRFGLDPARAARVSTYLSELPPNTEVPYLASAQAAQAAQSGDWDKAKKAVDAAVAKEPKDGIQQDLSILRGEIALAQRDAAGALTAWNSAHAAGASARTFYGLARCHMIAKAFPKAREAVEAALKTSPTHAGALTLRAQLAWELDRDDVTATKDLGVVLENRKALGSSDLSFALATRGWIMFARDRPGDARAAFDEAVKSDPRNVSALIGQGELLYADGRYAEALTRFDDAVQKDPSNILAMLGSAKTKMAQERLSDAKTQLTAARQKAPKDMNVALWLARVEESLGNKKVAEEMYSTAVDLADPKNPDAIQAYAASARFLAGQGKNAEAAAKLEQARAKLPDSAALQRSFGEVAVAQGQFAQALEHFEAALAKNPADLGTRFRLGVTYRKMHKLDLAAKALDEVAAIDKEYTGIALERGLLFEESGDVQKALEQFQSALQKAPNDTDLMLRVGAAYVAIGDTEKALPLLTKVKDQRPNSAEANHFLGRAYLKQGGLEAAAAARYLQRAVALDPNKAEYHLYVAWAANEATPAQLGLARTHIDKALQLDRLLADGYWQRGVLLRKEGQVNDAVKDLKKALELKPSRHEAHAALAEAYEDKNDIAGAMAEWQRAIAGDDKPPFWRAKYGKLLFDKGNAGEAAKHLVYAVEKGKALQPRPGWLGPTAFTAGEALKKTGQKSQACEHFQLFMELASPSSPDRKDATRAMSELACPSER